ncbi:MAG: tetratricopeptide repeat protein, partial [Myxococcales bacterium]|nr:tetratricopeptide repeat protein [Myxococcales bacterium]
LEGRLLVMQGYGNRAARTLQRAIRRNTRDVELLLAYGLALVQAEDDRNARTYLDRVLSLDASRIEAVLGVALIQTRRGDLGGAAQSITRAEELVSSRELGPIYEARALAARGRLAFEHGNFDEARQKAEAAIEKDSRCAQAHFVLAMIADTRGTSPVAALRAALGGRTPYPEVRGLLVVYDERAEDRCDLARHYAQAAPRGVDAREVRRVVSRCR